MPDQEIRTADMLKVACIQLACEPGNVKGNLQKAAGFIGEAKEKGAKLAILPELVNFGYDLSLLKSPSYRYHNDEFYQSLSYLSAVAQKLKIHITAGILEIEDDRYYNSVFVFHEEGILTKYRKLALFSLSGEPELFTAGNRLATFMIDGFQFGLLICFDLRFPEISRKYMTDNCTCLIVSAAFPFPRLDHWRILLKCRAIENQFYVMAANRVGVDNNLSFLGNSCIIDPWGTIKAIANETEETIIYHELECGKLTEVRRSIPSRESFDYLKIL